MEDRILYSVSPIPVDLLSFADGSDAGFDVSDLDDAATLFDSATSFAAPLAPEVDGDPFQVTGLAAVEFDISTSNRDSLELIFIDETVEDYQLLMGDVSDSAIVFVLDSTQDGIEQISKVLQQYENVDAVHLVTHGSAGQLNLGNTQLNNQTLEDYAAEIGGWDASLKSGADLLIYGCDLASNADGIELINKLGALCDCDVAASDDLTGSDSLGGDWDLEFTSGLIETDIAFSATSQREWVGKLGIITVDTTLDDISDGGDTSSIANLILTPGTNGISLREAIIAANTDSGTADTIVLGTGIYTLSLGTSGENSAFGGDLDITDDLTIIGDGVGLTIIDGGGIDRVFEATNNSWVTISGVTIQGGNGILANDHGGGIFVESSATVSISDTLFTGNIARGGGAVANDGMLTLTNVTIDNNSSIQSGGGMTSVGTSILNNVTVSNNETTGNQGGGIDVNGSLTGTNVTISGNTSGTDGGGIFTVGTVTLQNATVTNNTAAKGAGVLIQGGGSLGTIGNTIIAGNLGADVGGTFFSNGNNLIGTMETVTSGLSDTINGDQVGSGTLNIGSLDDNGGPTKTHALLVGSTAINNGNPGTAPPADQRGSSRVGTADIGAYEFGVGASNTEEVLATNDPLVLDEGATATISTAELETPDSEQTPTQVVYTVTGIPVSGSLWLSGTALIATNTFTQDDIDNDRITYVHNGNETFTDGFTFDVDDGVGSKTSGTFSININPINDNMPVADTESFTVLEGGTATEADLDAGTSLLDGDTDIDLPNDTLTVNTSPKIDADYGTLTLFANGTFSYVHDGSENFSDSFVYEVSDAVGNKDLATVTVTVTPVNDNNPVADAESFTVLEGGTATEADLDAGSSLLDGDTDLDLPNDALTVNTTPIVDTTYGTLTLNPNGTFSYVHDDSENFSDTFTYEVNDAAGNKDTAVVSINITPVNEAPTAITPNTFSVDEITETDDGYSLGKLLTTDVDTGETFDYTIQGGADQPKFSIGGGDDNELILTAGRLDFETQASYTVIVRATDSGLNQYDEIITVNVNDLAESAALWIGEAGSTAYQQIGDPGLLFEPVGGTSGTLTPVFDLANFGSDAKLSAIHFVSSNITIGNTTTFDLLAGDLVLTQEKGVTLSSSNTLAVEKSDVFVFRPDSVGDYSAGLFYMLMDNLGQGDEIYAITLVERDTVVGGSLLNAGSFLFTAKSTDTKIIENFDPDDLSLTTVSGTTTLVLDGFAPDVDINHDIYGLELVEQTTTVGGVVFNTGELLVSLKENDPSVGVTGSSANTEREDIFRLNIVSTTEAEAELIFDGSDLGLSNSTKGLTFLETTFNWVPSDIAISNSAVNENVDTTTGFSVGVLTASDASSSEIFAYSIVTGLDGSKFAIGGTGDNELILADGILDYESKSSYSVVVRVEDSGAQTYDETLTINVNDLNEAPTAITPTGFNVDEHTDTSTGHSLGKLNTSDEDSPETFVYTIFGGTDQSKFSIGGTANDELILTAGTLDFEGQSSYSVIVEVRDSGNNTHYETITTNVNDLNDTATVSLVSSASGIAENADTTSSIKVADIVITDEGLGTNTLALSGVGKNQFTIVGMELHLAAGVTLDHESQPNLSVTIEVDDASLGGTPDDTDSITIAITDINESPIAFDDSYVAISNSVFISADSVLLNDIDPEGDSLSVTAISSPTNGTVSFNLDGTFTYTPTSGFSGTEVFTYQIDDGVTTPSIGTVSMDVQLLPSPPSVGPVDPGPDASEPTTDTEDSSEETEDDTEEIAAGTIAAAEVSAPTAIVNDSRPPIEMLESVVATTNPVWMQSSNETVYQFSDVARYTTKTTESTTVNNLLGHHFVAKAFIDVLDQLRGEVDHDRFMNTAVVGSTIAISSTLSAGYVIWLIRGGVLLSSVMSSLPAWRMVDPLPVLGYLDDEDQDSSDDSLESLVTKSNTRPVATVQP